MLLFYCKFSLWYIIERQNIVDDPKDLSYVIVLIEEEEWIDFNSANSGSNYQWIIQNSTELRGRKTQMEHHHTHSHRKEHTTHSRVNKQ